MNRLRQRLGGYRILLGSASPRRRELLAAMGIEAEVVPRPIDESYPPDLSGRAISEYLALRKAEPFENELKGSDLLITSDTVVWHRDRSLEKPANREDAISMLHRLSGDWHEVITSIALSRPGRQRVASDVTQVRFRRLGLEEIEDYVDRFTPFDKAGGYGIQEQIGLTGIEEIRGSYTNVVGLPTQLLYRMLLEEIGDNIDQ